MVSKPKKTRKPGPYTPVNIPRRFKPLLLKEAGDTGARNMTELLGRILESHYSEEGRIQEEEPVIPTVVKGRIVDEKPRS